MYLQPLIVGIMTWFWIHEIPSNSAIAGGLLVLVSLLISNSNWRQKSLTKNS